MRRLLFLCGLLVLPCFAVAQFKSQSKSADLPATLKDPFGIGRAAAGLLGLDPSRLSISHSYQMGYLSMGAKGYTQGMYLNTLAYQFKMPLSVSFQWGIANQPEFGQGGSALMHSGPFISGAQLRYQPSQNFIIQLDYQQFPYSNPFYGRYRYGWW
jgi:hypothetical protein